MYESLKRPAHITLYNPVKLTSLAQEECFFSALDRAAYSAPFNQVLKNFNAFPEHTFYLDVEQNESIMNLKSAINFSAQLKLFIISDLTLSTLDTPFSATNSPLIYVSSTLKFPRSYTTIKSSVSPSFNKPTFIL